MLKGIDVSGYQTHVPWTAVADEMGCRFAIVKLSEGTDPYPDPMAEDHLSKARAAGLVVGGYFFLHPEKDPIAQAKLHLKLASDLGCGQEGDLPFFIDLESPAPSTWANAGLSAAKLRAAGLAYAQALGQADGVTPCIYTYPDFWHWLNFQLPAEPGFARFPLWQASYSSKGWPVDGQSPTVLRPWTTWTFWQWSDQGKLPNGEGVDLDVFQGDETDLQASRRRPEPRLEGQVANVLPDDDFGKDPA